MSDQPDTHDASGITTTLPPPLPNDPENHFRTRATRDAWMLFLVVSGLYVISQLVLTRYSILWGTAAGQILFFLFPAVLFARGKTSSVKDALRLRKVPFATLLRVTLIALVAPGAGALIMQLTQPWLSRYFADWLSILEGLEEQMLRAETTGDLVRNFLVLALIVPVCEEVLFRGAFQGTLERRGPARAILWSALMFAVVHLNPFHFIVLFLLGAGMGLMVWRTGSILPAIVWHAVNNAAAVLLAGLGETDVEPSWWINGGLTLLFGLLLWEFLHHTRKTAPAPSPLSTAPSTRRAWPILFVATSGGGCVLLVAAAALCFRPFNLGHDLFAPDYTAEDTVIVTGKALRPFIRVQPDDIVYWQNPDGQDTYFSRVSRIGDGTLTILAQPMEKDQYSIEIPAANVIGKVVWKMDFGEEMNEMNRQIQARLSEHLPMRWAWLTAPQMTHVTQSLTLTHPIQPAVLPLALFDNQPVVELSINGRPARFLVDTDSPFVCLLKNALEDLGLLAVAELGQNVRACHYEAIEGFVRSATIVIGDGTAVLVENALVLPGDAHAPYQGILSSSFLKSIGAELDLPAGTLRISGIQNPANENVRDSTSCRTDQETTK